ncbi:uncharacterized protein LOC142533414 [Primulina tabacum]|uniref:uncharacterized protein LOC142533414 n=1 Tax=Primulina tabacum TaxID=48773 RepID=UPI003F59D539
MFKARFYVKSFEAQFQNPRFHSPVSHLHKHVSGKPPITSPANQFIQDEARELRYSDTSFGSASFLPEKSEVLNNVQISHPWREWVSLMHELLKKGYFDAIGNPFARNGELGSKEANSIRSACLNFARDQHQLIRYLSRESILEIAGTGCPSTDRKVVNSGKRLRAYVGSNEENVCSSCILRGDCERAYVKANEDEGVRTVDVMRLLLTYSLAPLVNSVENNPCLNKKIEESVRILLKEMVEVISIEERDFKPMIKNGDGIERNQVQSPTKQDSWICPKCESVNLTQNFKCLRCDSLSRERLAKIAEEMEYLPLKKGDWLCDKCKFLNFARNTRCLMCKEKPSKRQLNPGEWECESCNYINFRRNMICLKCDHKRPITSNATVTAAEHFSNTVKNHQTHPWFGQKNQTKDNKCHNKSYEFVKNDGQDQSSLSSWNEVPGFMDFPVVGGKSEMSRDIRKQELWRMKVGDKIGDTFRAAGDDTDRFISYIFHGRSEYLESGGDDNEDEMAAWFGAGRRTSVNLP